MTSPRPPRDHVTAFVAHRIEEMSSVYGTIAEALRLGGLPKNAASRIQRLEKVTTRAEPGWAKALGFSSVQALREAAFLHANATSMRPLTRVHVEAIAIARALRDMSQNEAERIVRAAPQYWARPVEWWLVHILAEHRYQSTRSPSRADR